MIAHVEGIIKNRVLPLPPAEHPDTAEEVPKSQGGLHIFLSQLKAYTSWMRDLLTQMKDLLFPEAEFRSSLYPWFPGRTLGSQGEAGWDGELTGQPG